MHANSYGVLDLTRTKLTYILIISNLTSINSKLIDDWSDAFINSIKVRFENLPHDIVLPLSSGLDSGAIACAFEKLNIKHTVFSYYGNEHKFILLRRLLREIKNGNKIYIKKSLNQKNFNQTKKLLDEKISKFSYGSKQDLNSLKHDGFNDRGSHGLVYLLNFVKSQNSNIKILSSGQGGDKLHQIFKVILLVHLILKNLMKI